MSDLMCEDCVCHFLTFSSFSTGDMVVKALCKLQDMNKSLTVFEKYQGTYLLLVHPNEQVILSKSHGRE